jgi:hypothetical protein
MKAIYTIDDLHHTNPPLGKGSLPLRMVPALPKAGVLLKCYPLLNPPLQVGSYSTAARQGSVPYVKQWKASTV